MPAKRNTMSPNDYCTIAQATEIAVRVARRELLMAAGRDPEHDAFASYINGPINADAIPFIEVMVEEYSARQRLWIRLRTWWDLQLPRARRVRR